MNFDRFAAMVAAYGGAPARWPAAERAAAEALMVSDPRARTLAEEAGQLDQLLDGVPAAAVSAALTGRILASLPPPRRGLRAILSDLMPGRPVWQPVAGFAFALVMGVGVGVLWPVSAPYAPGADGESALVAEDENLFFNSGFGLEDDLSGEDQS